VHVWQPVIFEIKVYAGLDKDLGLIHTVVLMLQMFTTSPRLRSWFMAIRTSVTMIKANRALPTAPR